MSDWLENLTEEQKADIRKAVAEAEGSKFIDGEEALRQVREHIERRKAEMAAKRAGRNPLDI